MRVISPKRLQEFWERHPDAAGTLKAWLEVTKKATWRTLAEVRSTYPHADSVKVDSGRTTTVFNLAGNRYRLIAAIHYNTGSVYVLRVFTHVEYDRRPWKEPL